jgi:hypothetical protein
MTYSGRKIGGKGNRERFSSTKKALGEANVKRRQEKILSQSKFLIEILKTRDK